MCLSSCFDNWCVFYDNTAARDIVTNIFIEHFGQKGHENDTNIFRSTIIFTSDISQ